MSKNSMEKPSHKAEAEKLFLKAYESHADGLFRFLALKVSDREVASDLLQETFARAWNYAASGQTILEWKPFLFRTAYNLVVDTYRKRRSVSLDVLIEDQGFAIPDDGDAVSIRRAEFRRMRSAIDTLDEAYRDVLVFRFSDDLPPREIARIMGLTENVVSVRIHRGLKMLRERLGPPKKRI